MKTLSQLVFTLWLISLAVIPARAFDPKVKELSQKELPPLVLPDIDITTLPNGIKVYYLQADELPIVNMTAFFEVGTVYETRPERGITEFFMDAWRLGGSQNKKPDEIDEELEFVSADIDASAGLELSKFAMRCLKKDMDQVFAVYFDLLRRPAFDPGRIEIIRQKMLNGIKRRNEKLLDIANREFMQRLYGEDSPYAWNATPETIGAIDRKRLLNFYQENIAPNRMWVAASSPLSFKEFLKAIDPYLRDWKKQLPKKEFPTDVKKEWEKSTEFIHKSSTQSAIVMGHFGERRFNKDKFAVILANEVLGGSTFGSKLGTRIRTELGLAYDVHSEFGFTTDYGAFKILTQTKSESTVKTVGEIRRILTNMVEEKNISPQELELARERILNRLIFELDRPFNIVTMRLTYDYYGYPPNYLKVYEREIKAVKLNQVKEILDTYFFPQKLKTVIVGDKSRIKDLGTLEGLVEQALDNE